MFLSLRICAIAFLLLTWHKKNQSISRLIELINGADDGNRTHTIALGRQSSTTKLHLHYFLSIL